MYILKEITLLFGGLFWCFHQREICMQARAGKQENTSSTVVKKHIYFNLKGLVSVKESIPPA
jgi:hypothetical protein